MFNQILKMLNSNTITSKQDMLLNIVTNYESANLVRSANIFTNKMNMSTFYNKTITYKGNVSSSIQTSGLVS